MNKVMETVNELMDKAEFESVVVFDRCAVVMAQLESGEIVMEAAGSKTSEEFDAEKAVETCMIGIHKRLTEVVSAQMAEPAFSLTEQQAEMIVAMAECGMNPSEAAKKVGCSRSTVNRRLQKIQEETGKNPLSFFDLAQLLIEARQILGV